MFIRGSGNGMTTTLSSSPREKWQRCLTPDAALLLGELLEAIVTYLRRRLVKGTAGTTLDLRHRIIDFAASTTWLMHALATTRDSVAALLLATCHDDRTGGLNAAR
ncbi:hypothetical protein SPRG_18730 [Saprolegnia parasitica CBS 223.65]|uniref:Uncharacterized protein n=1 Tax=Saprolegnia parasitica (strain CBS 223.65) TaxID=695850 RepID=A0A067BBL8_SAPPC|nr:hypothetical protein SPRG_18730 [Saprolegnia parasitica CBS 223.65]KDO15729.1 hypothetical protein SPRG_18730 [Saprolegnia parasitica CBS 223.65]|eukprot:XP_012213563.1 hypothetical protein SPRG_18730 [Saprolegnia parasitica CBS 223.65]